jgi:3-methyladenine DNA glycosylase AlkD
MYQPTHPVILLRYTLKTLVQIQKQLQELSTPETKSSIKKLVPNSQKVYGVKMPLINELATELKDSGFDLINNLWQSGAFEEKMLAAKLIGKLAKKFPEESILSVEKYSTDINDWAVCDTLGMQSLKPLAANYQAEIFTLAKKLNSSKNLWQRRLSLVLVEVYTRQTVLHSAITTLIKPLEKDNEYYVRKAVVWLKKNIDKHTTECSM